MKVAIDTMPLTRGHEARGVGFYLKNLLTSLEKYHPEIEIIKVSEKQNTLPTFDLFHYPTFEPFFFNSAETVY